MDDSAVESALEVEGSSVVVEASVFDIGVAVVLSSVLDGAAVVVGDDSLVALVSSLVGVAVVLGGDSLVASVVGSELVGVSVVAAVSLVTLVSVSTLVALVSWVVVVSAVVLVETPVPTTCLFGMIPSGISSARMVAKPKEKKASIVMARNRWASIYDISGSAPNVLDAYDDGLRLIGGAAVNCFLSPSLRQGE